MPAMDLISLEEFLALPDDEFERELIRGELRERAMTRRNRSHARLEALLASLLHDWLKTQPEPRGDVFRGEVGCILRTDPPSSVGINVAYFSKDVADEPADQTTLLNGPPVLAIEILSPTDVLEEVDEKIDEYLATGVKLVWIVHPRRQTVTVYRLDADPELFNVQGTLRGDPFLPGLTMSVAEVFRRLA